MLLASVHHTVVNVFKSTTNLKTLRRGQYLAFNPLVTEEFRLAAVGLDTKTDLRRSVTWTDSVHTYVFIVIIFLIQHQS
jgi:hypothetical protein